MIVLDEPVLYWYGLKLLKVVNFYRCKVSLRLRTIDINEYIINNCSVVINLIKGKLKM